jgi:hypothetical protein
MEWLCGCERNKAKRMSFDFKVTESIKTILKASKLTLDDAMIDYLATVIFDEANSGGLRTVSQLYDAIGDLLVRLLLTISSL